MATEARVQFNGRIEGIRKVVRDGETVRAVVRLRPAQSGEARTDRADEAQTAAPHGGAMPKGLAALRRLRSVDVVVEDPGAIRYLEERQAGKGDVMEVAGDLCVRYRRPACAECGCWDPGSGSISCVRPLSMRVGA